MKKRNTDRVQTEEEAEYYHHALKLGLYSFLYIIEFLKEHPESRLKEYLENPCDSQEQASKLVDSFMKDPKTKFEYESMVEHVWNEVTGNQISLEGGRC